MLSSKAVKHDAVSAEVPMCTDRFQINSEKGMHAPYMTLLGLTCFCKRQV